MLPLLGHTATPTTTNACPDQSSGPGPVSVTLTAADATATTGYVASAHDLQVTDRPLSECLCVCESYHYPHSDVAPTCRRALCPPSRWPARLEPYSSSPGTQHYCPLSNICNNPNPTSYLQLSVP